MRTPPRYGVDVNRACPECGDTGVPLLFGLPVPEAREAAADGQLALGGCLVGDGPPNWQCPHQHRWRDPDEKAWEARLLAVLVAYGYGISDEPAET
jgi:hypothetical protein